jgi:hypothetical protein
LILDLGAYANDVTLEFSLPGKPTDNASSKRSTASPGGMLECPLVEALECPLLAVCTENLIRFV